MTKPDAPATGRNREPILARLKSLFARPARILEIGSGTGQHAVYFGRELPHLDWIASDRAQNHPGIAAWLEDAGLDNVSGPLALDVTDHPWPVVDVDHVFTANTCHIMPWDAVCAMFTGVGERLPAGGRMVVYGPFSYGGRHTSDSNRAFDEKLRAEGVGMGVRDYDALVEQAVKSGLQPSDDFEMPANNRLLVFVREDG